MTQNHDMESRRPLKVRSARFATNFAKWLSQQNITPNQISIMSVFFAALSAICLFSLSYYTGVLSLILAILAAVFIQGRLLCNLFDGMVAVEGGKSTAAGELFNDIPDRIADPLIIVAAGYAIADVSWASTLAWVAAILAVMTAYVRTLASAIGAPTSFAGPMAKQHRMAVLTLACCITALEIFIWHSVYALLVALVIITVGCIMTLFRRIMSAYTFLENQPNLETQPK